MRRAWVCALALALVLWGAEAPEAKAQEAAAPGRPEPPVPGRGTDWEVVATNLTKEFVAARQRPVSADARDSNLPLAALAIEKIRLRAASPWRDTWYEAAQEGALADCVKALACNRRGERALAGQTGAERVEGYLERAYFCRTDGSPQPYFVRLPDDYRADRAWPLILFLHGYVSDTSKVTPWVLPATQWKLATDRGAILVMPHGRRNSDFLGIGEVDVLRVIEEMQRFYRVDPDRIMLTGCSMGGYGAWAVGLRHPSRFASLGLISGQTDFFTWERRARDEVRFKSWCILQNNPLDLAVNARWLPTLVQHGELDNLVPTVHSKLILPVLQGLGYDVRYDEYKDQGHYIYWTDEPFTKLFEFVAPRQRVAAPVRVSFKTFTPRQGQAYWVDVRRLQRWGAAGEVDAQVAFGALHLSAKNVAELWLDLPTTLLGDGPLKLQVNGAAAGTIDQGPHQLTLPAKGPAKVVAAERAPLGRPRCGPAREVFNGPFLVAYATGGDEARQRHNRLRAARFQQVWWAFAEGLATVLPDTRVTAEQVRGHNLVIFGEPGTVRLAGLADPAALVPAGVTLAPGRYGVGQREHKGAKVGMYLLSAHPQRPDGLVLWCSGQEYGEGLPLNHQFDLLPDLLIYDDEIDWDGTNRWLIGGFLSPDFRLDESLIDIAPPRLP